MGHSRKLTGRDFLGQCRAKFELVEMMRKSFNSLWKLTVHIVTALKPEKRKPMKAHGANQKV